MLQLVDSLALGGAERVAVNFANDLPRDRYVPHLCTTRASGPLAAQVRPDVELLLLGKRSPVDVAAVGRLASFIRTRQIGVVHAHSSSVFTAALTKMRAPRFKLVWHQHLGRPLHARRPSLFQKLVLRWVDAVIAVSRLQVNQVVDVLGMPASRVFLVHNYPAIVPGAAAAGGLPGHAGFRVVCLAQLRPEKDHRTLLRAFRTVADRQPLAHLLLVGGTPNRAYAEELASETSALRLQSHVTFLGERQDVGAILAACDAAVLSSVWEGFPLSLLEYGCYGLPVVTTDVGECGAVLDRGRYGILVQPARPDDLGDALHRLLASAELRRTLGSALRERVGRAFSREAAIERVCEVYAAT